MCHVVPSIAKALHIRDVVGVATVYHRRMCCEAVLKRSAVLLDGMINGRADTADYSPVIRLVYAGQAGGFYRASTRKCRCYRPRQTAAKGFLGTPEVLVIEPDSLRLVVAP